MAARWISVALITSACGVAADVRSDDQGSPPPREADAEAGGAQPPASVLFSPAVRRVVLEVDFAPGAEPYTGSTGGVGSIWEIFRENAEAIFAGQKEIVYPSTLPEMERLDDVVESRFGAADILSIAARHRSLPSTADTVTFYVVFVNGLLVDATGNESPNRLGLSLGRTGVIAIFKPVIASTAAGDTITPRVLEQFSLVHELGHTVGLVDNGVPLASAHLDPIHPLHCSNTSCVMYWSNEGADDAASFVRAYFETGHRVIFGPECLEDLRAFDDVVR